MICCRASVYTRSTCVFRFTQPETVLAVLGAVAVYFSTQVRPDLLSDAVLNLVHLTCFSATVGMSFWVTFVAGECKSIASGIYSFYSSQSVSNTS